LSLYHYLNRIRRLDTLIRQKNTGSPRELASRLDISERWLFVLLDELRNELQCPIEYDRKRRSYYYAENGRVYIEFRSEMGKDQLKRMSGGTANFVPICGKPGMTGNLHYLYPDLYQLKIPADIGLVTGIPDH
jgi:hypothetical protein